MELLVVRPEGLYCPAGDFFIDPWRPVDRAVITHGHADHARPGHGHVLAAAPGAGILRHRLGADLPLQAVAYGEVVTHRGVQISLHPAGHVLGSAQVRVAHGGQVWVVSGDYKTQPDPTCAPFEPVRCDTFITECTFGLPVYRWASEARLIEQLATWWAGNAAVGRASVLLCYALGKAQRVLAGLGGRSHAPGRLLSHGAMLPMNAAYRAAGVALAEVGPLAEASASERRTALVLAPPSAAGSAAWLRRLGDCELGLASGWMQVRGQRRRRGVDRGFVMSDHADWPGLLQAIDGTGASRVRVTHGDSEALVRHLQESRGLQAEPLVALQRPAVEEPEAAAPEEGVA